MRFLSVLITLAIIGYAASVYLDSGELATTDSEQPTSKPKEMIDQAQQAADMINQGMSRQTQQLKENN